MTAAAVATDVPVDIERLAVNVRGGERAAVAAALNLLDDTRPAARRQAAALLALLPAADETTDRQLLGITGPPGAGKSSLTATLIRHWRAAGLRVAVLAVDPSSPLSGGALLGDRLRMQLHGDDDAVFIRSLADRGDFGGLSAAVWPMCLVLLAAFDTVLVETVGVGQRETDIAQSCDTTCFVAQPGAGDSIQFIKAGILEVPHILVVNKADMGGVAERTRAELAGVFQRTHPDGQWQVPVLATSATRGTGIDALAAAFDAHHRQLLADGELAARRRGCQASWVMKRLAQDYGQAGLAALGGEAALRHALAAETDNPFSQLERYRRRLSSAAPGRGHPSDAGDPHA